MALERVDDGVRAASGDQDYRFLRVAWIGWLTSLLPLCAWPALFMQMPGIDGSVVIHRGFAGICSDPQCRPEPWLITDWGSILDSPSLAIGLLLGAALPRLVQRSRLRRAPRAQLAACSSSLASAMAFGWWVLDELWMARFIKNYGCVVWDTYAVPEYVSYVAALLLIVLLNQPWPRASS